MYLQLRNEQQGKTVVHFIETAPSVLREVPSLKVIEYVVRIIIQIVCVSLRKVIGISVALMLNVLCTPSCIEIVIAVLHL